MMHLVTFALLTGAITYSQRPLPFGVLCQHHRDRRLFHPTRSGQHWNRRRCGGANVNVQFVNNAGDETLYQVGLRAILHLPHIVV